MAICILYQSVCEEGGLFLDDVAKGSKKPFTPSIKINKKIYYIIDINIS